jgi:hypothetical protein
MVNMTNEQPTIVGKVEPLGTLAQETIPRVEQLEKDAREDRALLQKCAELMSATSQNLNLALKRIIVLESVVAAQSKLIDTQGNILQNLAQILQPNKKIA